MLLEKLKTPVADHFALRRRKGDVGVELEIEGRRLYGAGIGNWAAKPDGSLRGGMEYVSSVLLRKNVGQNFTELLNGLKAQGSELLPTYRCSTHIHENYLDETLHCVVGTYVCWALIEPVVFRVLPTGRDGSLFCVSSYDSGDVPAFIERFCDDLGTGGWRPRGKYSSLNVSRLGPSDHPALGTLEYRVFPPTLNPETLQEWCNWTGNIKEFVRNHKDETYLEMVRGAEAAPMEFIQTILGKCPFSRQEAGDLIDFGARHAYEIVRIFIGKLNEKPVEKPAKRTKTVGLEAAGPFALGDIIAAVPAGMPVGAEVAPAQPVAGFQVRRRPMRRAGGAARLARAAVRPVDRA